MKDGPVEARTNRHSSCKAREVPCCQPMTQLHISNNGIMLTKLRAAWAPLHSSCLPRAVGFCFASVAVQCEPLDCEMLSSWSSAPHSSNVTCYGRTLLLSKDPQLLYEPPGYWSFGGVHCGKDQPTGIDRQAISSPI